MYMNIDKLTTNNNNQHISHFYDSNSLNKFNHKHKPISLTTTNTSNSYMNTNSLDSSLEAVVSSSSNASITSSSQTNETLHFNSINNQQLQASNEHSQLLLAKRDESFILNDLRYRSLCPQDKEELKVLCQEWFPVEYPENWYNDITTPERFFSQAVIYQNRIIAIIVAEVKYKRRTDREDCHILSNRFNENTKICYILSLGVNKEFRGLGIASLLLDKLLEYLEPETDCKAVYLHVLHSNSIAIRFYEKRKFERRLYLPNYYTIKGQHHDGYCYVLYVNGGEPPENFLADCMRETVLFLKFVNPFRLSCKLFALIKSWFNNSVNRYYINAKEF